VNISPEARYAYCADENVRARMFEFFGEATHGERPAVFLAVGTESGSRHREALPLDELKSWMNRGVELNRSLWDRVSLICHLDFEYVNFDDPAYPFLNEERIFALQEPVISMATEVLASHGIHPLKLMTGRGRMSLRLGALALQYCHLRARKDQIPHLVRDGCEASRIKG